MRHSLIFFSSLIKILQLKKTHKKQADVDLYHSTCSHCFLEAHSLLSNFPPEQVALGVGTAASNVGVLNHFSSWNLASFLLTFSSLHQCSKYTIYPNTLNFI